MKEIPLPRRSFTDLVPILGAERIDALVATATTVRHALAGRAVWQINSTAVGGGVAEMVTALLPYALGAGIDARWLVISGDERFFDVTKRICLMLYGHQDVQELSPTDFNHYTDVLSAAGAQLIQRIQPGDVVVLHDPQTAGLVASLRRAGAFVIWRCHIGSDVPTKLADKTWKLLASNLDKANLFVFSTRRHVPPLCNPERVRIIPPCIDPLSPKNRELHSAEVLGILSTAGVIQGPLDEAMLGTVCCVSRITGGSAAPTEAPLVVQVSRWDLLKDMAGVMFSFVEHVADASDAHLILLGPDVAGVADDPAAAAVLNNCLQQWGLLAPRMRARIHLATASMDNVMANALLINAVQRHTTVVAQKSIAEGFGLTVTEAMWKARPIVATAVGGITEQIRPGEEGLLVDVPHDLNEFGRHLVSLLSDEQLAARLGRNARQRVLNDFVPDRHLSQWAQAITALVG
jgi:trehalose synthase